MPCLCRENGGQQVMFFWHLHVLPPINVAYLIRIGRLLIEQIQATVLVIRFVRDRYAGKNGRRLLAQKKIPKKIPKKKRLTNTI